MNISSKMSFAAEIELLKKLDHPNIIKLYDLFMHDGNYYVVTEFCEGGSLQEYYSTNDSDLKEETVKVIMKQLFSTLTYLYNQSIVHRDLKL
jgi:calcium-dependent protein kinase